MAKTKPCKTCGALDYPVYNQNTIRTASQSFNGLTRSSTSGSSHLADSSVKCMAMNMQSSAIPNEAGVTVPGSESNQKFQNTSWFATESQTEVIVLHLVGTNAKSQPVQKAVTVDVKPTCGTCHKVNKAADKFCSRCGTALEII